MNTNATAQMVTSGGAGCGKPTHASELPVDCIEVEDNVVTIRLRRVTAEKLLGEIKSSQPAHASEPWTDEQVKGTLEAHGINGITRAHNATLQPAHTNEKL